MLCVAIWYVSIRPVVMRVKVELYLVGGIYLFVGLVLCMSRILSF